MRRFLSPTIVLVLTASCAALLAGGASATTRDEAETLCRANSNCEPILRSDDGAIYCVRQPNGTCINVICPTNKPCYIWRVAGDKRTKIHNTKVVSGALERDPGTPGRKPRAPVTGLLETGPMFQPDLPDMIGGGRAAPTGAPVLLR